MILRIIIITSLSSIVDCIHLYDTEDSVSVEFFDCIYRSNTRYCRRPNQPILLQRNYRQKECYHNGIPYSFVTLQSKNISVNTILHQWSSSIEKVEEYSQYLRQTINELNDNDQNFLCQCTNPYSFGKNCEYLLPIDNSTFEATVEWEMHLRFIYQEYSQYYSDILCYTTLICDSGRLCLDWRDICDGIQQCIYGYDEEVCNLLEFNECADNEYRCMNGMCIPEEHFLDGEYDCMDLTDEKQLFNGIDCTYEQVNLVCDDRICLPNQFSCGDGQCIDNRLVFQQASFKHQACTSLRDRYYMCETNFEIRLWTLPNGKCSRSQEPIEWDRHIARPFDLCLYSFQCSLGGGLEKDCLCNDVSSCRRYISMHCPDTILYPIDRVVTSYIVSVYANIHYQYRSNPNFFLINATIKCRGFFIVQMMVIPYPEQFNLRNLEFQLCNYSSFNHTLTEINDDHDCHSQLSTSIIDVCQYSRECISPYRIKDSILNCADGKDEEQSAAIIIKSCSPLKKHRFHCSTDQPSCLFANKLGDGKVDCQNKHDEFSIGDSIPLSEMICNDQLKNDCEYLRQYIEKSWDSNPDENISNSMYTSKISFHRFCDTFYDLKSKKDEDFNFCQKWWICSEQFWQCHTGQCISVSWILDGEWDCSDASDEEAIFIYNHTYLPHNLKLITIPDLIKKFNRKYQTQAFSKICNLTIEYPCFRIDVTDPLLNLTYNRPCINLTQIGDDHIDCIGGIDERNTFRHCTFSTTLGRDFLCVSSETCISEFDVCKRNHRCPNPSDDHILCYNYTSVSSCSSRDDFLCIDRQCANSKKCNNRPDCFYGEDEYDCNRAQYLVFSNDDIDVVYRLKKQTQVRNRKFQRQYVQQNDDNTAVDASSSLAQEKFDTIHSVVPINSLLPYACNRGIGILTFRNFTNCFCPPQYYGSKCQFHSDRLSIILHLNLSQSIYVGFTDPTLILKLLVLFLFNNQTLTVQEFHLRPAIESIIHQKLISYGLYSRTNQSIAYKQKRYFNRSKIIHEHPYTVRIEAYELIMRKKPQLIAVWQYPIYFDFLPVFRLSKVLRLHKPTDKRHHPCFSNPCTPQQECYQLENERLAFICLCRNNYTGTNCSILDPTCSNGYCSPQALCKPTYRGILSGNERPFCVCPSDRFGHRCELENDVCNENPCQNNGSCYSGNKPNEFICICDDAYYGRECKEKKQTIKLDFHSSIQHTGATIQYFILNPNTFDLILLYQRVFITLPQQIHELLSDIRVPEIILSRFYVNKQRKIYLITFQTNTTSINRTIDWHEQHRCSSVEEFWSKSEEISPIKYHSLCFNQSTLKCFYDDDYFCICMKENINRAECFGYDHHLDQCSYCLVDAQCLQEDRSQRNRFICLCSPCYYGSLCQFSGAVQSFSLYSLFATINFNNQLLYLTLGIVIFIFGGMNNYASFITFKRSNLYKLGVGRYLLISSLISQSSLLILFGTIILNLFPSFLLNKMSCKIFAYLLSILTRCSSWLLSWVTLERLFLVIFPFNLFLKKPIFASIIIIITIIVVSSMHIHESVFYNLLEDPNKQILCIANFTQWWSTYNRLNLITHYLIPFCIQIISITILIVLIARNHSRTKQKYTFIQLLQQQFKTQKELYIAPLIIIVSSLPQVLLSFIFSCTELLPWQRHTLLTAYFLSYGPQLLGFVVFVLPSKTFLGEFRETRLSKLYLFK